MYTPRQLNFRRAEYWQKHITAGAPGPESLRTDPHAVNYLTRDAGVGKTEDELKRGEAATLPRRPIFQYYLRGPGNLKEE